MANLGKLKFVKLTDKQLRKMIEYYGDRLPDPVTYPKCFEYYVKMYLFLKKK